MALIEDDRCWVSGLLVANVVTVAEFSERFRYVQLPIADVSEYLGYTAVTNWAAGLFLAFALALPLCRVSKARIWPGWIVAGGFWLAHLLLSTSSLTWPMRILLSATTVGVLVGVAHEASRRVPALRSPWLWSLGILLTSAVLLPLLLRSAVLGSAHSVAYLPSLPVTLTLIALPLYLAPSRRHRAIALGGALLLVLSLAAVPLMARITRPESPPGPDVILISVDTLRRDHLGLYGNPVVRTPHIDSLSTRCIVFDNATTPIPMTNPAHTTMLTGRFPGNHGVVLNRPLPIKPVIHTLPRVLRDSGFLTAGVVSGLPLTRHASQLHREFDVYDDRLGRRSSSATIYLNNLVPQFVLALVRRIHFGYPASRTERRAEDVVLTTQRWLRDNAGSRFFLFVHFFDPHGPYQPPPPYATMYSSGTQAGTDGDWYSLSLKERERLLADLDETQRLEGLYKGEISYVDEQIGRLLATMSQLDLWERTLLIFTSDHGEILTDHPFYFDHGTMFDPTLRIPLIVCPPGGLEPHRISDPVQLVDLYPSILDFLDLEVPENDGQSLMPLLRGRPHIQGRVAVSALFPSEQNGRKAEIALRTNRYKYVRTSRWWGGGLLMPASEQLYDLEEDPGEQTDVLAGATDVASTFRAIADQYFREWFDDDVAEKSESEALSKETLEGLRSLGYL